jgi:hypothetical protein
VGCLSGNVFGRFVRVPETIGSRRLTPAIQEWFAFQAKFDDLVGNGGSSMRASEAGGYVGFPHKGACRAIKGFQKLLLYTSNFSVVNF